MCYILQQFFDFGVYVIIYDPVRVRVDTNIKPAREQVVKSGDLLGNVLINKVYHVVLPTDKIQWRSIIYLVLFFYIKQVLAMRGITLRYAVLVPSVIDLSEIIRLRFSVSFQDTLNILLAHYAIGAVTQYNIFEYQLHDDYYRELFLGKSTPDCYINHL